MQICVCGWYYYHDLLHVLDKVVKEGKHSVTIIAHRHDPVVEKYNIKVVEKENIGVEYGAYDYFIKNEWDKKSKVLFMHDDIHIKPLMKDYKMLPKTTIFNTLAHAAVDIGYIFKGQFDELQNFGVHGRGIIMSARFIQYLLDNHDGIWFDKGNDGHINGPTPEHCEHFNEADYRMRSLWEGLNKSKSGMILGVAIHAPSFNADIRGGRLDVSVMKLERFG
jgi:hypothetical protein